MEKNSIDNIVVKVDFGIEKCVICKNDTPYLVTTPIAMRINYIECMGQVCDKCFNEYHQESKELEFIPRKE